MLKKYYSVFGPALRVLDAIILSGSWILAYYLRKKVPLSIMHSELPPFYIYGAYIVVIILLWGTVFSIENLYSSKRMTRRITEIYKVLRAHSMSILIFISLTFLLSAYKLSRGVFLYFFFTSGFLLAYSRLILRNTLRRLRSKGYNVRRILIVGTGPLARYTYRKLTQHPELGLNVLGFCGEPLHELKVLGTLDEIPELIKNLEVEQVVIALSRNEAASLEKVLSSLKDKIIDLTLVPDIYDHVALGCEVEDFDGLALVNLNETPIMGLNLFLKRISDLLVASFFLLASSPIMLLVAAIIKFSSRGPIFFAQERMSLNGKSFKMIKFRSMRLDQEGDIEILTREDDPRVTRVGRILRRTSLDELPQFFNVLKGDMSIVGPRPERTWVVEEVRTKIPRYMLKHKVKAGITGWAQVNGWRGNTSLEKRVEYDLYYIKNWSILFDFKILVLTVFRGLMNRNAY